MTQLGIEPAVFRLVALSINQLNHCGHHKLYCIRKFQCG